MGQGFITLLWRTLEGVGAVDEVRNMISLSSHKAHCPAVCRAGWREGSGEGGRSVREHWGSSTKKGS